MGEILKVKIETARRASGCLQAADLVLVLGAIDRAIRAATPEIADPRLTIARIGEDARTIHLRMDDPLIDAAPPQRPLAELVNAQAAGRDGLCLETWLPPRINSLELFCGDARATACNRMSYDNWPKAAKELRARRSERRAAARPYSPPPDDQLLNFDVEQFNREVAEARADEQAPWWE